MPNRLTQFVPLAVASLLALTPASLLVGQTSAACSTTRLPAPVSELLKTSFSSWRPKQTSDLEAYDRQLWLKTHPKECPGIAVGNFESAERTTYAVLLVPKSKSTGGYKIVVFHASQSGDTFASKLLDHSEGQAYPQLVIASVPPGKHSDFENTKSIKTTLDSILVDWIEGAAVLYYWSGSRYHTLQVSD